MKRFCKDHPFQKPTDVQEDDARWEKRMSNPVLVGSEGACRDCACPTYYLLYRRAPGSGILTMRNLHLCSNQFSRTHTCKQRTHKDHLSSTGLLPVSICFYVSTRPPLYGIVYVLTEIRVDREPSRSLYQMCSCARRTSIHPPSLDLTLGLPLPPSDNSPCFGRLRAISDS